MARLSKNDVLKLARLARLDLSSAEVEEYLTELNEVLAYVEQLQSVDTKGTDATNQVSGLTNVMREDKLIEYGYDPKGLLKNVPEVNDGQIQVKRMVE
ncbi:MAG: Asp-tRNA(Asn)/Glu-tRNA(Gln) amidotransferase subunit GatC [Candidatus Saccharimonadales bacterium]